MLDDFKPAKGRAESLPTPLEANAVRQKELTENNFKTPDQVAASASSEPVDDTSEDNEPVQHKTPKRSGRFAFHWPPGKKEIIAAIVVVVLIGGGITAWALSGSSKPAPKKAVVHLSVAVPKSDTVASDLTGLPVSPSANQGPVTGVMIENTTYARPQSGLSQAGVVFEAVAEGGVTRFLALYQGETPSNVGPIRSVRPYYLQWALGFDAAVAHVGGSPDALADIPVWNVRDLDEFYNGSYYHRISSREAPHNMYTSIADLNQLETVKGYTSSTYTSWPRKADAPSKDPTAGTINLTLSGSVYDVQYTYDATTDSYNRAEGGAPQIDANTNTQLSPKVVVAMVIPETQGALDSSGAYYSDYASIGSGTAYVFQDGTVTTGTWSKPSNTAQITFTDSNGQPIKFNAGQTWLTAITGTNDVTYTP